MLYFADYSGDADSSIIGETWAKLIDQALSKGGVAEACPVPKRVGSRIYPGNAAFNTKKVMSFLASNWKSGNIA